MFILPPALVVAFDQPEVSPIQLVSIDWPQGKIYMHTGVYPITYLGNVWLGMGTFGGIGSMQNNDNIGTHQVDLTLSGIDSYMLNNVVLTAVINRDVEIHMGALDSKGALITAAPLFYGRVSSTRVQRYGDDAIGITATSKTADWDKSRSDRYTDESHRAKHPTDDFFQYVADMASREIYWNSEKTAIPLNPRGV
jgi:hypothetical protein